MEYLIKNIKNIELKDILYFYDNIYNYKKNKINKLVNDKNKIQSIEGEILLSKLLKKSYNLDYRDIKFEVNNNEKPLIINKDISFNISHSFDYVITCISNKNIGVDIEKIRKTNLNTINQFATAKEKKYILSSKHNIEKRLFTIYTLKEAYIKCKGNRINDISNIEFIIDNSIIKCSDNSINIVLISNIRDYIIAIIEEK